MNQVASRQLVLLKRAVLLLLTVLAVPTATVMAQDTVDPNNIWLWGYHLNQPYSEVENELKTFDSARDCGGNVKQFDRYDTFEFLGYDYPYVLTVWADTTEGIGCISIVFDTGDAIDEGGALFAKLVSLLELQGLPRCIPMYAPADLGTGVWMAEEGSISASVVLSHPSLVACLDTFSEEHADHYLGGAFPTAIGVEGSEPFFGSSTATVPVAESDDSVDDSMWDFHLGQTHSEVESRLVFASVTPDAEGGCTLYELSGTYAYQGIDYPYTQRLLIDEKKGIRFIRIELTTVFAEDMGIALLRKVLLVLESQGFDLSIYPGVIPPNICLINLASNPNASVYFSDSSITVGIGGVEEEFDEGITIYFPDERLTETPIKGLGLLTFGMPVDDIWSNLPFGLSRADISRTTYDETVLEETRYYVVSATATWPKVPLAKDFGISLAVSFIDGKLESVSVLVEETDGTAEALLTQLRAKYGLETKRQGAISGVGLEKGEWLHRWWDEDGNVLVLLLKGGMANVCYQSAAFEQRKKDMTTVEGSTISPVL